MMKLVPGSGEEETFLGRREQLPLPQSAVQSRGMLIDEGPQRHKI